MTNDIKTVAALESCIGKVPGPMNLKVIDHLDAGAMRWLASSPLMVFGFGPATDISVSLAGGPPGFVDVVDSNRLRIPKASLDDPAGAGVGIGFGALSLIPTVGETLRVNGRVVAIDGDAIELRVDECYVHCAKALIRSGFWSAAPMHETPDEPASFLAACRFIALASIDTQGQADVSPKGDPAGAMIRLSDDGAWFADRPGNRRADSFRNMLVQPRIAIAALIPGATRIALLRGEAHLTADEGPRDSFAVQGKTPHLATRVGNLTVDMIESAALARAAPWPAKAPKDAIDAADILKVHVKLSKERGLHAAFARAALSVPGLMRKGLERDYKTNLY